MLRKAQCNAILGMIAEANKEGTNLSMEKNIYADLKKHPQFPSRIDRKTLISMVKDLISDGLLVEEEYIGSNRSTSKKPKRVVVTAKGHEQMEKQA